MKSYRDLEIFRISYQLALESHRSSLKLPKYELYELGSQLRRSTKSIVFNITEGYGRKRYKLEFIRFLVIAHASCDEALVQLEMVSDLYPDEKYKNDLIEKYQHLGRKINKFIQYVESDWK